MVNATQCDLGMRSDSGGPVGFGLNWLGIALACVGSVSINIGNNLQAKGHADDNNGIWILGTCIFFLASIIQFVAFAFAPVSVVAPLESLQFLANLVFAKFINQQTIAPRAYLGTFLIFTGLILCLVNGPVDGKLLIPLDKLMAYWDSPAWIIYLSAILILAGLAELARGAYSSAAIEGETRCGQASLQPLAFSLSSALIGTQAVVQAKALAEATKLVIVGCAVEVFTSWYPYVTLVILVGCGGLWLVRLNLALKAYDPLFILPLLQGQYILCATLSGGIYFQEFNKLTGKKVMATTRPRTHARRQHLHCLPASPPTYPPSSSPTARFAFTPGAAYALGTLLVTQNPSARALPCPLLHRWASSHLALRFFCSACTSCWAPSQAHESATRADFAMP